MIVKPVISGASAAGSRLSGEPMATDDDRGVARLSRTKALKKKRTKRTIIFWGCEIPKFFYFFYKNLLTDRLSGRIIKTEIKKGDRKNEKVRVSGYGL